MRGRVGTQQPADEELSTPGIGSPPPVNGPQDGDFDCSGLTTAAYAAAGIELPRTAQTQYNTGPRVPSGEPLLPGDLVFYGTPSSVGHVGLYFGGNKMINAPTFGQPVQIAPYHYNNDQYAGASRPVN
jgi:cell wall-associated NlpC family hydrolase